VAPKLVTPTPIPIPVVDQYHGMDTVGEYVGASVGRDGDHDGLRLGDTDGLSDGDHEGDSDGESEGDKLGLQEKKRGRSKNNVRAR